ncbi:peptidylprolyl isomerase [Campylobacter sp. FMV-PI01]|uniref:peptidylprolyl isomerase n=1 Tax=Campylobacter portucalensis TaxID=2608384 RepID=A0A6L5WIA1_9BACT|nr:peptidylprolyl isomerase [Campylobacter portucalensis]MSN96646.1 peptidylprolyl isomerase [Campylobacter portucalensis]
MTKAIMMNYELKDSDSGELLETNLDSDPIGFLTGLNQILPKLEEEVLNLSGGSQKVIKISSADGLGEYDPKLVESLPKEQFAGIELHEGMELFGESESGETTRVIVKAIGDEEVMIDFNHPFAGRNLEFTVKVVENRDATEEEIKQGFIEVPHTCRHGHTHGEDHECCGGHHHHGGGCGCHH